MNSGNGPAWAIGIIPPCVHHLISVRSDTLGTHIPQSLSVSGANAPKVRRFRLHESGDAFPKFLLLIHMFSSQYGLTISQYEPLRKYLFEAYHFANKSHLVQALLDADREPTRLVPTRREVQTRLAD